MIYIAKFINKNFIILLIGVICFGIFFGYIHPKAGKYLEFFYPFSLFVMLFPMMITIKINEVANAFKRVRFVTVVMILNYFVSPLLAAFIAYIFLSGHPEFAIGLIINGTVPCGGMIVAWTMMSKGNTPMTLVIMVLSLLAGIILIPFWIWVLVGKYVPVDAWKILQTVLFTLVVPLFLGNSTRRWLTKKWGPEKFDQVKPAFTATSMLGLFSIFLIAMMSQSVILLENPHYLGVVALPLMVFQVLLVIITMLYAWLTKTNYPDMVSLYYSVNGKNLAIALALAVVFFSPLTVLVIAVKSVIQVSFAAVFYRITPYLQKYWIN